MPLPTSGLTGHWDASTNADLYQTFSSGVLSNRPANGGAVNYWDDQIDPTVGSLQTVFAPSGTAPSVTWHSDGVMRLPSVRINNGKLRTGNIAGSTLGFTNFMTVSNAMMLLAFLIDSTGTYPDSATPYFNCTLIGGERNTYWSVYIRKTGSVYTLYAYNWDGNADTVSLVVTPDQPHVLCMRHQGGTLSLSLDCGSEVSVASGNTANSTPMYLGDQGLNSGTTAEFRGRIGEVAFYNVGDAATALTAREYLCDRWLPPEIVDEADPTLPDRSCTVSAGGGQSAGGCLVQYPTIGVQTECAGGGLVPTRADIVHSETWWGRA